MLLKNKNIIFKIRRSKVTDYAALKAADVTGDVLTLFKSYLSNRFQRVVLPETSSDCVYILAGVTQGSVLGHMLFLIIHQWYC